MATLPAVGESNPPIKPSSVLFPLPEFPEYTDPAWKALTDEWVWKAEAARVVENGIDLAHASFVHPVFGMEDTAQDNQIFVGVTYIIKQIQR